MSDFVKIPIQKGILFPFQNIMAQVKQRKVALMGFRSVGKSSLAIQFVQVILRGENRQNT